MNLLVFILHKRDLRQIFQRLGILVRWIQQIIPLLIVDFQVAEMDSVRPIAPLTELLEDQADCPGDDPPVGVAGGASSDGERFAGPGLSVGKDGTVDSVKSADNHLVRGALEDDVLGRAQRKSTVVLSLISFWLS